MALLKFSYKRTYNPREMIEMDRFVHKMSGKEIEDIKRESIASAGTMKDTGMTINRWTEAYSSNDNLNLHQDGPDDPRIPEK